MASGLKSNMHRVDFNHTQILKRKLQDYFNTDLLKKGDFGGMDVQLFVRCQKHPRYAIKKAPASNCENCWWLWSIIGLAR